MSRLYRAASLAAVAMFVLVQSVFAADATPVPGQLGPADVLTAAGLAVVTAILVGVIVSATEVASKFRPLLALVVGVALSFVFTALTAPLEGQTIANALLNGILVVGSGSMAVHDVAKSAGIG